MRHDSQSGLVKGDYKNHPNSVVKNNHSTGQKRLVFKAADPLIVKLFNLAKPFTRVPNIRNVIKVNKGVTWSVFNQAVFKYFTVDGNT